MESGAEHSPVPKLDQLCAAAAHVGEQARGRRCALNGAVVVKGGFLLAGEHPDGKSGPCLDGLAHLLGVGDVPQGGGGEGENLLQVNLSGHFLQLPENLHRFMDALFAHPSLAVDIAYQTCGVFLV